MGCVPSNPSSHQQPNNQVINPNHHFHSPSNTNHTIDHANTMETRASFQTTNDYDRSPDSSGKKDSHDETQIKRNTTGDMGNMEFQKVASLKQWLQAPGGGGVAAAAATAADSTTPKFGFSFYDDNKVSNNTPVPE
ncbi:hypothetical protein L1987_02517 [Smallanthus sonchifolius]|uniref:Uncharacterized protein n=1 Tax=Smallanthus sonchifolius TaxID=185202 RepID=A0ACB9K867_9ASTR|nr:hypothetical protein L1987_02517 [Smallanthus sonchifolius]